MVYKISGDSSSLKCDNNLSVRLESTSMSTNLCKHNIDHCNSHENLETGIRWEAWGYEELTDLLIGKQTADSSKGSSREKGNMLGPRSSENFLVIPLYFWCLLSSHLPGPAYMPSVSFISSFSLARRSLKQAKNILIISF